MPTPLNINDFQARVRNMLNALPDRSARINDGLAQSAVPMIVNRLIDLGQDGNGKPLGDYSDKPLPTFFYLHKGTGSGADKKLEQKIKSERKKKGKNFKGISYKDFRELNNRPTAHVTLSFTGETLGDLGVTKTVHEGGNVVSTIESLNTVTKAVYNAKGEKKGSNTTQDILDFLGARYGENILALTDEEEKKLSAALDVELDNFIKEYLE
jgi:hypothetical protein